MLFALDAIEGRRCGADRRDGEAAWGGGVSRHAGPIAQRGGNAGRFEEDELRAAAIRVAEAGVGDTGDMHRGRGQRGQRVAWSQQEELEGDGFIEVHLRVGYAAVAGVDQAQPLIRLTVWRAPMVKRGQELTV